MTERKFVRPGVGPDGAPIATRNPATMKPLSPEGEYVDVDSTTRRRLREGDWVEASPPPVHADGEPKTTDTPETPAQKGDR